MEGTVKCSANYVPLTPISFLERSAIVYRDRISVVYGDLKFTWAETRDRCARLASALHSLGISRHDIVSSRLILGFSGLSLLFTIYLHFLLVQFVLFSLISMLQFVLQLKVLQFVLLFVNYHD